jgi:hypothetical protein
MTHEPPDKPLSNNINAYPHKDRPNLHERLDLIRIKEARREFLDKNFQNCLNDYCSVEQRNLLNNLDYKIIEFSQHHIAKLHSDD